MNKILCIILLQLVAINSQSEPLKDSELIKYIDKSVLIFKGKLIEKYSREENFKHYTINRDREITEFSTPSTYTTYVFEILEILKGSNSNKTIKVIRKGGCNKKLLVLNKCMATTLDYDYSLSQVGVMFLSYRHNSTIYRSLEAYRTALILNDDNSLTSQSSFGRNLNSNKIIANKKGEMILENNLSFSHLKSLINTVQKSHEN